ncbi:ABC transporter ATP-binding protein [Pseudodesulfovibrio piezophilus]|uniref:Iron(3+)-hydroxamate import ATP-binding protein FhuC n=1 Tax=Pseudodesulfovibrio piezophilus (strain DSM 21447 / JCM 15486 / C1TLV30) TaxID=1322246 RepID=M1WYP7_PSEP2|nr:ABC transporter ATP-binding protein [Pseudodesulfovibrio piezophilus]CCH50488.1 Iron(3+)-hydroxamate import ATP-binding protein FhuC [Pseudodesulfovibrio piezophilus C1TLV30]
MNKVTYTLEGIDFGYDSSTVLHNLNVTFEPGYFHAIVGPNGSGKSTLLDLVAGHLSPQNGRILINDSPMETFSSEELARLTATVPQEFNFNFPFTVEEIVFMGRHPYIPRFSRPTKGDREAVEAAMNTMDITLLGNRALFHLSGGERQRTIFARALAQSTPGLLLDEPTSSMDIRHTLASMAELKRLAHTENHTIVAVLHDLNMASAHCDRIMVLNDGTLHSFGTPSEALTTETIQEVFGVTAHVWESELNTHVIIYEYKE